jgi:hypothetical protein
MAAIPSDSEEEDYLDGGCTTERERVLYEQHKNNTQLWPTVRGILLDLRTANDEKSMYLNSKLRIVTSQKTSAVKRKIHLIEQEAPCKERKLVFTQQQQQQLSSMASMPRPARRPDKPRRKRKQQKLQSAVFPPYQEGPGDFAGPEALALLGQLRALCGDASERSKNSVEGDNSKNTLPERRKDCLLFC